MSSKQWLAVAAWVFAPVAVAAQLSQYDPSDAGAPVSAIGYESAFKNYRAANDVKGTPDKAWRAANEEMRRLGGHAGHMKDSADQSAAAPDANNATPKQDRAVDHHKHR